MHAVRSWMLGLGLGACSTAPLEQAPRGEDATSASAFLAPRPAAQFELVERWRVEGSSDEEARSPGVVVATGDLDGDGVREVLAPHPGQGFDAHGQVWVLYGASGKLRQVLGGGSDAFGAGLTSVGDCDGDGLEDVLVADGQWFYSSVAVLGATLFSTASGESLQRWRAEDGMEYGMRVQVLGLGDIDGDGAGDCGIELAAPRGFALLSSRTGDDIAWPAGDRLRARIEARLLARVADYDADGVDDFTCATKDGGLVLVSGAARRALWTRPAFDDDWVIQEPIVPAGDVDRDGVDDLAAVEWNSALDRSSVWRIATLSGRDGRTLRTHELTAPQGDSIALAAFGELAGVSGSMLAIASGAEEGRELTLWSPRDDVVLHRQRLDSSSTLVGLGELDGAALFAAADESGAIRAYALRRVAR